MGIVCELYRISDQKIEELKQLEPDIAEEYLDLNYASIFGIYYPIYASELEYIEENGIEQFWKHPDFDMYDVNRKRIQ